jgi:hypothetical protein
MVVQDTQHSGKFAVRAYDDGLHGESLEGIEVGEYGYKYRILDGLVLPPYITPKRYALSRSIPTRSGDICFNSYPKSGSTWLSYVILLLTRGGEKPEGDTLRNHFHWVASSWPYPRSRDELEALPSPRIFKSHMPYRMALGGVPTENPCRYVYVARSPKDVVVSYYHFESGKKWSGDYAGPWEHWLSLFAAGGVQRGDWFEHVLGWWEKRDAENILFLKYEDLKRSFDVTVQQIAGFLGFPLDSEVLGAIREKTSFANMKSDEFSNLKEIEELGSFFRRGEIGSWKDQFTVAQSEWFDRLCAERLEGTGLEFE